MAKQNSKPESKFDIYAVITDRIISELEKGRIPWKQPWIAAKGGKNVAYSRSTGRAYSLLNQMMLGRPGEYLTFKQVQEAGGHVRKGEKSHMVVFWKQIGVSEKQEDGTEKVKFIPYLKYYNVFHIDQCDGVKAKYDWDENKPDASFQPDEQAEQIVSEYLKRSGVKLIHEAGNRAFYRPSTDSVTIPEMEQFKDKAEYYSTLFHELTHSTGHASRLDRIEKTAAFGNEEYSREELVAEIGAAALNNQCGLETENSFKNSAAYIQSWLQALKNDKRMIVVASGKAEKAVAMINGEGQDDPAPAPDDKPETVKPEEKPEAVKPEAEAQPEQPAKAKARKTSAKLESVLKRVYKNAPKHTAEKLGGVFTIKDRYGNEYNAVTDSFRIIAVNKPVNSLPRVEGMDSIGKIIVDAQGKTWRAGQIEMPALEDVEKAIAETKIRPHVYAPFRFGEGAVNPEYLRDIMQALPGCIAYKPEKKNSLIYFEAPDGIAALCPVYCPN